MLMMRPLRTNSMHPTSFLQSSLAAASMLLLLVVVVPMMSQIELPMVPQTGSSFVAAFTSSVASPRRYLTNANYLDREGGMNSSLFARSVKNNDSAAEEQLKHISSSNDKSKTKNEKNQSKKQVKRSKIFPPPPRAPMMKFPQVRRPKLIDRTDVFTDDLPYDVWPIPPPITTSSSLDILSKTNDTDQKETGLNSNEVVPAAEGDFTTSEGQTCFVSNPSSPLPKKSTATTSTTSFSDIPFPTQIPPTIFEYFVELLPVTLPLLAFSTYEMTAEIFDQTVEYISNNNWVAVDGGQYQANIITPAINGLVVPSIALLFATLVSNTINTLRQRQLQIRTSLNIEANDMRMLSTMVDSLPMELQKVKNHLREYLIQYSSRIIGESKPGLSVDNHMFIGSMDHEMNGFLGVLNKLSMCTYGTVYVNTMQPPGGSAPTMVGKDADHAIHNSASSSTTSATTTTTIPSPPPEIPPSRVPYPVSESHFQLLESQLGLTPYQRHVSSAFLSSPMFSEAYDALTRLRNERSTRLSALQFTYPMMHYVLLALLASSICIVFLMETNQELLIFLSAIQLKILWGMLIGTFSALGVVNYDMVDPFRGRYNVAVSVDQFYTIRESIRATIHMEQEQIRRDKIKADDLAKKINSTKKEPGNTDKDKIAERINANGET
mmetsp:Transcript_10964/g.23187  ORF Transcript_10964/g.23187 Transcript_10964/m.23187 type:complete len:663 (-) Transcript_10964:125-2113(-)